MLCELEVKFLKLHWMKFVFIIIDFILVWWITSTKIRTPLLGFWKIINEFCDIFKVKINRRSKCHIKILVKIWSYDWDLN